MGKNWSSLVIPGDYYPVSKEEYDRALELAARVLHWVKAQIMEEDLEA